MSYTSTPVIAEAGPEAPPAAIVTKRVHTGSSGLLSPEQKAERRAVQQALQDAAVTQDKPTREALAAHRAAHDKSPVTKEVAKADNSGAPGEVTGGQSEPPAAEPKTDKARLERLNRQAARERQREKELKDVREQANALGLKARELDELVSLSKTDRVALLEKLGLDLETIATDVVKQGKHPKAVSKPADPVQQVADELKALKSQNEQEKQEKQKQADRAQYVAQVGSFASQVNDAISAKPDDFELIIQRCASPARDAATYANLATEDAVQLANDYYREYGQVLPPAEVARSLEAYYLREAEAQLTAFSASKKLQDKFGLTKREADAVAKKVVPVAKKEMPTMGGRKMQPQATSAGKDGKRLSDKERLAQVVAWGRQEYAKAQLAKAK